MQNGKNDQPEPAVIKAELLPKAPEENTEVKAPQSNTYAEVTTAMLNEFEREAQSKRKLRTDIVSFLFKGIAVLTIAGLCFIIVFIIAFLAGRFEMDDFVTLMSIFGGSILGVDILLGALIAISNKVFVFDDTAAKWLKNIQEKIKKDDSDSD